MVEGGQISGFWEQSNAGVEKLIARLEARSIPYVRVPLDIEEIKQFCEEQGIPNDGKACVNFANPQN